MVTFASATNGKCNAPWTLIKDLIEVARAGIPHEAQHGPIKAIDSSATFKATYKASLKSSLRTKSQGPGCMFAALPLYCRDSHSLHLIQNP